MYINILIGAIGLFLGGEVMVRGAVSLARIFKLSPMLIGLTVLAFATSFPELIVSIRSVLLDMPGLAIGNPIGSNIANSLLVLGCVAVMYPIMTKRDVLYRDGGMLLFATVLFVVLALTVQELNLITGVLMLGCLGTYLFKAYQQSKEEGDDDVLEEVNELAVQSNPWIAFAFVIAGFVILYFGADIFVDGAAELARSFGVSETVIGLTIVALGTSLPELVASLVAAWRKHTEMALGNVIGSNLFNILAIMGTTSVVKSYPIVMEVVARDMWVLLAVTVLIGLAAYTRQKITRLEGVILLTCYVIYIGQFMA